MVLILAALVLLVLGGCGIERVEPGRATSLVDSLGVTYATTRASALEQDTFAVVAAEPLLTIGGDAQDSASQLFRVRSAHFIDSTTLAVLNAGSWQLRFYGLDGRLRAATRGRGDGPGELQEPSILVPTTTSQVAVWDAQRATSTIFGADASVLSSASIDMAAATKAISGLLQMQALSRWVQIAPHKLLVFSYQPLTAPVAQEPVRPRVSLLLSDFAFKQIDTLGSFGTLEQARTGSAPSAPLLPMVYAHDTYTAAGADSALYVGDSNAFRIQRFRMDGRVDLEIRVDGVPAAVTDDMIAEGRRILSEQLGEWGVPTPESLAVRARVAATLPAFRGLVVDSENRLWVRRLSKATASTEPYCVFDSSGVFLGRVALPRHDRLLAVNGNRLVLLRKREFGTEEIAVFEFQRG